MIEKIKKYWAKNTSDLITGCNFISRVLRKLIFISFGISILLIIIGMADNLTKIPDWLENTYTWVFFVTICILIYSAKVFLIVIPFVWLIQCWYSIKGKEIKPFVFGNLFLWLLITLLTTYSYVEYKRYDECMAWCVNEDQSNFKECSFGTCDFVF